MASITEVLVLPDDVQITPVDQLDARWREGLDAEAGHFAVSRPGARARSCVVDPDARDLLECFREPRLLVDAVVHVAVPRGDEPGAVLDAALPLVAGLLADGMLVGVDDEPSVDVALDVGDVVLGAMLLELVYAMEDTTVFRGMRDGVEVAVKVGRRAGDRAMARSLDREAEALARIGGRVAPDLLATGRHEGHPVVVTSWVEGRSLSHRLHVDLDLDPATVAATVRSIVAAYAAIHQVGVRHGDVHPGNVLVTADGQVRIIDFGQASIDDDVLPRGGVPAYHEPEGAAAMLRGRGLPPPTTAGEQYVVATLLVEALCGVHPITLPLDAAGAAQAIVDHDPTTVVLPDVVAPLGPVLARARHPDPDRRHPDTWALLDAVDVALKQAFDDGGDGAGGAGGAGGAAVAPVGPLVRAVDHTAMSTTTGSVHLDAPGWVDDVLGELGVLDPAGIIHPRVGPRSSVFYGSAGVAFALAQAALADDRPDLLDTARTWAERAVAADDVADFRSEEFFATGPDPDQGSLFHGRIGPVAVLAIVAAMQGDTAMAATATQAAIDHGGDDDLFDPMMGPASRLRMLVDLHQSGLATTPDLQAALQSEVARLAGVVTAHMDVRPDVVDDHGTAVGAAHGWAGALDAILRAAGAGLVEPGPQVWDRIDQVADLASLSPQGATWPVHVGPGMQSGGGGWCNGSAGHVSVFTAAHGLSGEPRHLELAVQAATAAAGEPSPVGNLCCGSAGKAIALLEVARATGDESWVARADRLVREARALARIDSPLQADLDRVPLSLWKGHLGMVVAAAAVARPHARMPFVA